MKKLSAYESGVESALIDLGLIKTAILPSIAAATSLAPGLLARMGKFYEKSPVLHQTMMRAGAGGLAGAAAGSVASEKGNWAAPIMGGVVGAAGGAMANSAARAKLMEYAKRLDKHFPRNTASASDMDLGALLGTM